ncbi:MAG: thioesterase family protein [Pseudomonadota bacterium]
MIDSQWLAETAVNKSPNGITNTYLGRVVRAWNIGDNPNGGYLTSLVIRAMRDELLSQDVSLPDLISVTTHYLRPGLADCDAGIEVEILKAGRNTASVRGQLIQQDKSRIEVLAMFGDVSRSVGVEIAIQELTEPEVPPPQECLRRSGSTQGIDLPIIDRLDVYLDPRFSEAGGSEIARVQGWIRMADGSDPQSNHLPLFCDAFPPSVFTRLGVVGWVPTLELTVHVRARPVPGWVKGQFTTRDLNGGRMIESGALWDATGNLVAQSRQIGLVMQAQ